MHYNRPNGSDISDYPENQFVSKSPSPDKILHYKEEFNSMISYFQASQPKALAYALNHAKGYTHKQIGNIHGIAEGTSKSQKFSLIKKYKNKIDLTKYSESY